MNSFLARSYSTAKRVFLIMRSISLAGIRIAFLRLTSGSDGNSSAEVPEMMWCPLANRAGQGLLGVFTGLLLASA